MKKKIVFAVSILCIGTVLTELAALGMLTMQGKVTDKTLGEMLAVLDGQYQELEAEAEDEANVNHSQSEFDQERINRSYELDRRSTEIDHIGDLLRKHGQSILGEQSTIKTQQKAFNTQLDTLRKNLTTASLEKARGILKKMPAEDALGSLMPSNLEDNIQLLNGMQEKKIAEILQQFMKSTDPKVVKRGQDIFQAISMGEPEKALIETAIKKGNPDFK